MSDDGFALEVALVAALILLNGFFAGAEIAVISARKARIRPRAAAGDRRAQALLRLKADPDRFLATVQIGVTLVGTLASAVGGVAAVERFEPLIAAIPIPWMREMAEPIAVGTVVFTIAFLSLVIGELVPKSLAVRHAEAMALWAAVPVDWLARTARVAVTVLTAATRAVLGVFGQRLEAHSPFHNVEDIRAILDEADAQGVLDVDVMKGALEFQDYDARLLMTPRGRIVGLSRGSSIEDALRIVGESGYSRFPVYRDDLDTIEGVAYARDLYEAQRRGLRGDISPVVQPAFVIPGSKKAKELLAEMRREHRHMALVVNEHGIVDGLVTLEDVLEAIVGDIKDERDEPHQEVRRLGENVLEVDGGVAVKELNARYDLELPAGGHYVTAAGLLLERLGALPRGGEQVEVPPYRLTAAAVKGRRITRIRIERVGAPQPV
jgi:putative hemolysin